MGYTLLEFVKKTGIFLICAESILHFLPGTSYQKYVKVLVGIMILAQFLLPVKALLAGAEKESIERKVLEFRQMVENQSEEIQTDTLHALSSEEKVEQETKEEIKLRLNKIASERGYEIEEIVLGEKTHVILREKKEQKGNRIEKIRISEIGLERDEKADGEENPKLLEMKALFCEALGTGKEYLEVREGDGTNW